MENHCQGMKVITSHIVDSHGQKNKYVMLQIQKKITHISNISANTQLCLITFSSNVFTGFFFIKSIQRDLKLLQD